jgi:catalase-peroxidase
VHFVGTDPRAGTIKWIGTRVDNLWFKHTELRAIAEVYGSADGETKLLRFRSSSLEQGDELRSF